MIKRAYGVNDIVLYSSCDDNYAKYLAVALTSILFHISNEVNYDFLVFCFEMREENVALLENLADDYENASIRVVKIKDEIQFDDSKLMVRSLTKEIWLKALAIYAMTEYEKAIVIDCDVICLKDVSNLYKEDLGDSLIGAVKFLNSELYRGNYLCNSRYINLREHGIDYEESYFNYGVVLQNLKLFREMYSLDFFIDMISTQKYLVQDQDLMNVLCRHSIKWIDSHWNVFPFLEEEYRHTIGLIDFEKRDYWNEAHDSPGFIHYTIPVKPWFETKGCYSLSVRYFWYYASVTKGIDFDEMANKAREYERRKLVLSSVINKEYRDFEDDIKEKKLYVYGFGKRGKELLNCGNYKIEAFIDGDDQKWSDDGIPVRGLESLRNENSNVFLISNDKWDDVALMLHEFGIGNIYSYACLQKKDSRAWRIDYKDLREVSLCFGILADDVSQRVYDRIIHERNWSPYDRTIKHLDVQDGNIYFNEEIFQISNNEKVLILGKHVNYIAEYYDKRRSGLFDELQGIEEGKTLVDAPVDKLEENSRCLIYHCNISEILSNVSKYAENKTLIVINSNHAKQYIEMCSNLIQLTTPKLAIEISYDYSALWDIPLLVKKVSPDYKLYIRHHMSDRKNTVLYATK